MGQMQAAEQGRAKVQEAERELAVERDRLAYLRGQRERYAALDDNPDGYSLTIGDTGRGLSTTRTEMVAAVDQRIRETEHLIDRLEHPEKPRPRNEIRMHSRDEWLQICAANDRLLMIAGA